jgi:hypothetical protein
LFDFAIVGVGINHHIGVYHNTDMTHLAGLQGSKKHQITALIRGTDDGTDLGLISGSPWQSERLTGVQIGVLYQA